MRRVLTELKTINNEWKSLGIALELDFSELKEIEANYPTSVKDCMAEVIARWLRTGGSSQVSWKTLCDALRSDLLSHSFLAQEIEEKYCTS